MKQRGTPWRGIFLGVVRLFFRPAMLRWTTKAFSLVVMGLIPLSAVSAWGMLSPGHRFRLIIVAALGEGVAGGFYLLAGRRKRKPATSSR